MQFNKVLQISDYEDLQPEMTWLSAFFREMGAKGLSIALNHTHRRWEYGLTKALVKAYKEYMKVDALKIIDVGSAASPLGIALRMLGHEVWSSDSCDYGNPVDKLIRQCLAFNTTIPWILAPAEWMPMVPSGYFDITVSISVMEHVRVKFEKKAWLELKRITKPGGLIFTTMDFHPDPITAKAKSPFKGIQETIYNEEHLREVVDWLDCKLIDNPEWVYHGDLVHNYSFCSLAVRKPLEGTS